MANPKILIIPGNGDSHIETDHWYAWVRDQLREKGYAVLADDMPDPVIAHQDIWLKHIEQVYRADENTIIIGHSSGGVASLRYLENHQLLGAIIIGVNHTDLGDAGEKESGYYNRPWLWKQIRKNSSWISQFASVDDPYIPIEEPRFIHKQLGTEYHEYRDRGHFMVGHHPLNNTFPELITLIESKFS